MPNEQSQTTRPVSDLPRGARVAAAQWWSEHKAHVHRLIVGPDDRGAAYPPSGSDVFHPELWRAPHWRWLDGVINNGI